MKQICYVFAAGIMFLGCTSPSRLPDQKIEWGDRAADARVAYEEAMGVLAKGRQTEAELQLAEACEAFPDAQRLWFFRGVLYRSRSDRDASRAVFATAYELGGETLPGRITDIVVPMDLGAGVEEGFARLEELIRAHPQESLLRWLYAMESASFGLHVGEAIRQLDQIGTEWKYPPAMMRQTRARLLLATGRSKEALEQQLRAAEMEPGGDTYQMLAYIYSFDKRYEEADRVYEKLMELVPDNALYWIQWGSCLAYMGNYAEAAARFEKAFEYDASMVLSLVCRGRCLQLLGHPGQGFAMYEEAIRISPRDEQALSYAAHAKLYGYGTNCDFEWAMKACAEPGKAAIANLRGLIELANKSENPLAPARSAVMMKHLAGLAEKNDPEAQYSLAMIYRHGLGVEKDEDAAAAWFKRAAENGHEIAERMLNPPF